MYCKVVARAALPLTQQSTVKSDEPPLYAAFWLDLMLLVAAPRYEAEPNLCSAVVSAALLTADQVADTPPALLSVNVVEPFVPSRWSSIFVKASLPGTGISPPPRLNIKRLTRRLSRQMPRRSYRAYRAFLRLPAQLVTSVSLQT